MSPPGTRGPPAVVLVETIRTAGFDELMSVSLRPWRKPLAVHDPGKIVLDLAVALALGGDCLADVGVLRAEPGVFGPVASDPTVSRLVDALAADADRALMAIEAVRAQARARVWALTDDHAPDRDIDAAAPLVIDLDATLVTSHSEKESAAPTFKRGFGFHPLIGVPRPRPRGDGGTAAPVAAAGERGLEHRRRPHHRDPHGTPTATRISTRNAGAVGRC